MIHYQQNIVNMSSSIQMELIFRQKPEMQLISLNVGNNRSLLCSPVWKDSGFCPWCVVALICPEERLTELSCDEENWTIQNQTCCATQLARVCLIWLAASSAYWYIGNSVVFVLNPSIWHT